MEWRETHCDHLIDAIYDAGACPEHWPSVLSSIASTCNGLGAIVFGFSKSRGLVFEYNGALDPVCANIFKMRHTNNAWVQGMAQRPRNQLVVSDSLIKKRHLMQSTFFDEVLKPQHIAHGALASLVAGDDIEIQFSVQKSFQKGTFATHEIITLKRLLPHVRRALGVTLRLSPKHSGERMSALTDQFGCAALTLNRRGELVEANARAWQLVQAGSLSLFKKGLQLSCPSDRLLFLRAMKDVLSGVPMRTIVLNEGQNRIELVCAALQPRYSQCGINDHDPASVLLLIKPLMAVRHSVEKFPPIQVEGSLTNAEWRVTNAAVSGISKIEIARSLGVSLNTVKTHLRRIYHKLDVKRQSELIILLNRTGNISEC
jgi:DNA-binding CsgD family transcriptional regulator